MTIELNAQEKIAIIEQHLKNVLYTEYNAEVSLVEYQSVPSPLQESVSAVQKQLADIALQKAALNAKIAELSALPVA
jgi:hypothetical protein